MRLIYILLLMLTFLPAGISYAGGPIFGLNETDAPSTDLYAAFDLRDRESFVQVTNIRSSDATIHVQIYDVSNLCNENNFFDVYTPNDTHTYDLRNILTNDGNPSGVVLPDNSYGIVFISFTSQGQLLSVFTNPIFGNFRIVDNNGYEYRTNMQSFAFVFDIAFLTEDLTFNFNFNSENGVILSDVFGIPISITRTDFGREATLDDVLNTFFALDVDIINNNEVLFSCRDVIFACIDENSPLLEELIEIANSDIIRTTERSSASVARFEYGINNSIPHSKGGELLCPGNNIPEGIVKLTLENSGVDTSNFAGYIGLNNGNDRGSLDSFFTPFREINNLSEMMRQ